MGWQMLATLIGMVAAIIGGVWAVERRFEGKLKEVKDELKAEITENRQLIIEYIAKNKA